MVYRHPIPYAEVSKLLQQESTNNITIEDFLDKSLHGKPGSIKGLRVNLAAGPGRGIFVAGSSSTEDGYYSKTPSWTKSFLEKQFRIFERDSLGNYYEIALEAPQPKLATIRHKDGILAIPMTIEQVHQIFDPLMIIDRCSSFVTRSKSNQGNSTYGVRLRTVENRLAYENCHTKHGGYESSQSTKNWLKEYRIFSFYNDAFYELVNATKEQKAQVPEFIRDKPKLKKEPAPEYPADYLEQIGAGARRLEALVTLRAETRKAIFRR